ncbi:MAG: glycosyltransferase, partial [Alistipes sp.]|nr:glycosyltransferase [Alistipes sp.]
MKKLLQINPVVRISTSTGRIMQEIGELAMQNGWESYIAYGFGRDGHKPCTSQLIPVGNTWDVRWHGVMTRLFDRHGLASKRATRQFIEQIKQIDPDIIHIHNIHGYFLNYPILFDYLSTCGKPVIWTVHDCWLYTGHCYHYAYAGCYEWETHCKHCPQKRAFPTSYWKDRSSKNFIDKRNAFTSIPKDLMRFVTVSAWMRNEMSRSFLKDYDFQVIHNGIDTSIFQPRSIEAVKQKYGLADKRHILLGVASIWSDEKGLSDFLSLAEHINEEEIIVLVGVDESLKNRLPKQIKAISRTENIEQLAEL